MSRARAAMYAVKSGRFQLAASRSFEGGAWDAAISAAVHALISAVDAACVRRLGERAASDDHLESLALLRTDRMVDAEEWGRLKKQWDALLGLKFAAEYEDRLCTEEEARRALRAMERGLSIVSTLPR